MNDLHAKWNRKPRLELPPLPGSRWPMFWRALLAVGFFGWLGWHVAQWMGR